MGEPIEDLYFKWLCAKVLDPNSRIYLDLLKVLHCTEFVWVVHGDYSRAQDGLELREDFLRETRTPNNSEWECLGCSIFEMLIALSKRASFQTGDPVKEWFWELITNLGLEELRQVSHHDYIFIDEVLHNLVWRQYDVSGQGGLFPMRWPKQDQTKLELYYQFNEYLDDQGR